MKNGGRRSASSSADGDVRLNCAVWQSVCASARIFGIIQEIISRNRVAQKLSRRVSGNARRGGARASRRARLARSPPFARPKPGGFASRRRRPRQPPPRGLRLRARHESALRATRKRPSLSSRARKCFARFSNEPFRHQGKGVLEKKGGILRAVFCYHMQLPNRNRRRMP